MTNLEKATFAAGCFWGVEYKFKKHFGDIKTCVGYTGGKTKNPKYNEVCSGNTGHTEACQIEFDPTKTSYRSLLEFFYKIHDPTIANERQYRSVIFYHSSEQKKLAEEVTKQLQEKLDNEKNLYSGNKIVTEFIKASVWYDAEEYHQKYFEKNISTSDQSN